MPGQRVAVGLACGAAGWIPRSGETRSLQDPDVAMRTTTKTMMASPRNATKYSEAERPRRLRPMARMVPQIWQAPPALGGWGAEERGSRGAEEQETVRRFSRSNVRKLRDRKREDREYGGESDVAFHPR